jgi:hypothetical protein
MNKLLATEIDFPKRSAGISRRDKVRNKVIPDNMSIKHKPDITHNIKSGRNQSPTFLSLESE